MKILTNMKPFILFLLSLLFIAPVYADMWEAQVITDGDYGLELDWAYSSIIDNFYYELI